MNEDARGAAVSGPATGTKTADQLQADLFKALSHPTRVTLVEALLGGERSTGSLVLELGIEAGSVSQQLGVLREARLVRGHRDGAITTYELAPPLVARSWHLARQVLLASLVETRAVPRALEGAEGGATI